MEVILADEEELYENGVDNLREYAENPKRLAEFMDETQLDRTNN